MKAESALDARHVLATPITIVGGTNVDIKCHILGKTAWMTSNPGRVDVSVGGVGRNITENLWLLGANVALVTVLGRDAHGEMLKSHCHANEISLVAHESAQPTGTYTAILDEDGDLVIGVAAMDLMSELTPDALEPLIAAQAAWFKPGAILVLDANLPVESVVFLSAFAQERALKLVFEPVSVPKCVKIRHVLMQQRPIFLMSPNQAQLTELTGISLDHVENLPKACAVLHAQNVQNLIIGRGPKGAFWSNGVVHGFVPALAHEIIDATGGGDAALAGAVWALAQGKTLEQAAHIGQIAASLAVSCAQSVNRTITATKILQILEKLHEA